MKKRSPTVGDRFLLLEPEAAQEKLFGGGGAGADLQEPLSFRRAGAGAFLQGGFHALAFQVHAAELVEQGPQGNRLAVEHTGGESHGGDDVKDVRAAMLPSYGVADFAKEGEDDCVPRDRRAERLECELGGVNQRHHLTAVYGGR